MTTRTRDTYRQTGSNKKMSARTCSGCGDASGPSGLAGLNERSWACACGAVHDRDVNAAINILARGFARLDGGSRGNDRDQCRLQLQEQSQGKLT